MSEMDGGVPFRHSKISVIVNSRPVCSQFGVFILVGSWTQFYISFCLRFIVSFRHMHQDDHLHLQHFRELTAFYILLQCFLFLSKCRLPRAERFLFSNYSFFSEKLVLHNGFSGKGRWTWTLGVFRIRQGSSNVGIDGFLQTGRSEGVERHFRNLVHYFLHVHEA